MWKLRLFRIVKVCYLLQYFYIEKLYLWFKVKGNIVIFLYRDRIRIVVNVVGDVYGVGIVEYLLRNDLMLMDYSVREDGVFMEFFERYTFKNEDINNVYVSDLFLRVINF